MNNLAQKVRESSRAHHFSFYPMDNHKVMIEVAESEEHDELGETVFYDLSPVSMALYYSALITD